MASKSNFEDLGCIKVSSQLFLCNSEDEKVIYLVDPKTLGILDRYNAVKMIKIDWLILILYIRIPILRKENLL